MMEKRELIFKALSWVFEDRETDMVIHVSGMTQEGKTVQIQIEKFTPFCYLQLPKRIKWTKEKCKALFDHFILKHKSKAPLNYSLKKKKNLYFLKEGNYMFLTFSTNDACRGFERKCISKQYVSGVGMINDNELLVHEHNIDPILKVASMKNILLSGWVKVVETIREEDEDLDVEDRKFSYADIDMYVHYQDIEPHTMKEHVIVTPGYCSFDIECYSVNHNSKLPDPKANENEVFQIALIFGKMGSDEPYKTYLLTKFDPMDIEDCKVLRFKTEKALLLSFTELIKKMDPLFFIGYNIMKFDWDYMISRADKLGILDKFLELTRIIGKKANIDKVNWSSSAYKEQEFRYPNCIGRTQLDVLIEVERNFKLPIYSLNAVAGKFLGEQKDDISPRQLFMFYKITKELLPILEKETLSEERMKELQKRIKEILPFRQTHGIVRRHRRHMLNCGTQKELTTLVRECLTMTLRYCRQDTILPIKIIEKLNLLTTMEEMSNVMHIPMSYLHTRGQQIKVLAQVFRETIHNGIIIPYNRKIKGAPKENFEGAIVAEAHAGDYNNVGTLDFASLYPSTMIAFNICYSTLASDPAIPDEDCHVLKWTSHVGCVHDPKKRKKKGRDGNDIVICGDFKYRFLKVKITYDEKTKEVHRENEGVMPRLERNLLLSRSEVKKEMLKAEARLKMTRGEASEDDIQFYKLKKFEIIPKDYLSKEEEKKLEVFAGVLNAKQLAIKVSANSTSATTPIPCLVHGRIEYKYIEELFDEDNYKIDEDGNEVCFPKNDIRVWSDKGWSDIKYVFRHEIEDSLIRVITKKGMVDVTRDHSLLDEKGNTVSAKDISVGDRLLHHPVDLPLIENENCQTIFSLRCSDFLESSKIIHKLRSQGYTFHIDYDHSGEEIIISFSKDGSRKIDNSIVSMYTLKPKKQYVYDIETSSHHFAAGVGDLIVHNSAYGALGAGEGFIPLISGAASVTAMGRELITSAIRKIRGTWTNCKLVYGDSVTGDTPIIIRDTNKKYIHIIPISDLDAFTQKNWVEFPFFKLDGEDRREKERIDVEHFEIWGNGDWFPIRKIIRHKVNKKIYRVQTGNGVVDVTEDHSLLRDTQEILKPKDAKLGDSLLTSFPIFLRKPSEKRDVDILFKRGYDNANSLSREIPDEIINGTDEEKKSFVDGYLSYFGETKKIVFQSKIKAQQMYYLLKHFFENISIGISDEDKMEICISENQIIENPSNIQMLKVLYESYNDYVYDIETSSGQFHAGLGEIVLKNTDSCMLVFENSTLKEAFDLCKKASRVVTHYLKSRILGYDETLTLQTKSGKTFTLDKIAPFSKDFEELEYADKIKVLEYDSIPTDLSFECMYGRFLLLTKKRYIAYKVNEDGQVTDITKKGVVLARRDNSPFLKLLYKQVSDGILNMKSEQEVLYVLYDEIHKLFTRRVPDTNLIIPVGVNKLIDYAKKKKYSIGEKEEVFFVDKNGDPIEEPNGPLDPRLVYPNLPQVLLSLKMIRRGTDVPPNTRLEQIFLENKNAVHQGDKAEDYTYYKENRAMEGLKIDYLHYIEKIQTPLMELLNVKYPRTVRVHYEKMEDAIKRIFSLDIDPYKRSMIARTSSFIKTAPKYKDYWIGWDAFDDKMIKNKFSTLSKIPLREYPFKGTDAKIECILSSWKNGEPNDFSKEDPVEAEMIEVCRKYKAKYIIDRICSQHKTKKRTSRKPTQCGNKIIKTTGVYIKKGDYANCYGFVLDFHILNPDEKEKRYLFDIQLEDSDEIVYKVPRDSFTTYHLKDSRIMKDIYDARTNYKNVVEEMKDLFTTVILPEE